MMAAYARYKEAFRTRQAADEDKTDNRKPPGRMQLTRDELHAFQRGISSATNSLLFPPIWLPHAERIADAFEEGSERLSRTVFWYGTVDGFHKLPLELLDAIFIFLPAHSSSDIRGQYSDFSVVCQSWAKRLRPRLFRKLSLRDIADVQFLHAVLSSPLSRWLAPFVENLTVARHVPALATAGLHHILGCVTSLSINNYVYLDLDQNRRLPSLTHWRIGWSSLKSITLLTFRNVTFTSFRIFLEITRAFKMLRHLRMIWSSWSNPRGIEPKYLPWRRASPGLQSPRSLYFAHSWEANTKNGVKLWVMDIAALRDAILSPATSARRRNNSIERQRVIPNDAEFLEEIYALADIVRLFVEEQSCMTFSQLGKIFLTLYQYRFHVSELFYFPLVEHNTYLSIDNVTLVIGTHMHEHVAESQGDDNIVSSFAPQWKTHAITISIRMPLESSRYSSWEKIPWATPELWEAMANWLKYLKCLSSITIYIDCQCFTVDLGREICVDNLADFVFHSVVEGFSRCSESLTAAKFKLSCYRICTSSKGMHTVEGKSLGEEGQVLLELFQAPYISAGAHHDDNDHDGIITRLMTAGLPVSSTWKPAIRATKAHSSSIADRTPSRFGSQSSRSRPSCVTLFIHVRLQSSEFIEAMLVTNVFLQCHDYIPWSQHLEIPSELLELDSSRDSSELHTNQFYLTSGVAPKVANALHTYMEVRPSSTLNIT